MPLACPFPLLLPPLRAVLRSALLPTIDSQRIQRAPHNVVPHAGQVSNATTSYKHDRMFLKIVPLAPDVRRDLFAVAQPNAGDLAKCRVGLFGSDGLDLEAHTTLLRAGIEVFDLVDPGLGLPGIFNELIDRWHESVSAPASRRR